MPNRASSVFRRQSCRDAGPSWHPVSAFLACRDNRLEMPDLVKQSMGICQMGSNQFPGYYEAPRALFALDGNCGPMSVWLLLRHFHKRTSFQQITQFCRYTQRHGTFTIALALALREHGLSVSFHTEEDPDPMPIERRLYKTAERSGVVIGKALQVKELLDRIRSGEVAIVCFETDAGEGHFSPLIGVKRRKLVLPYTDQGKMDIEEFERRWTAPGICRQCVFATR
jgi:hypothetical protein